MSIPHNLRLIRKRMRLSQDAFADAMNASRGMINQYEQGKAFPQVDFLLKLTYLTGISLEELLYQELTEGLLPESMDVSQVEEPSIAYRRKLNLYDVRNMVQEIERMRQEIEEIKKANPPKSE